MSSIRFIGLTGSTGLLILATKLRQNRIGRFLSGPQAVLMESVSGPSAREPDPVLTLNGRQGLLCRQCLQIKDRMGEVKTAQNARGRGRGQRIQAHKQGLFEGDRLEFLEPVRDGHGR